MTRALVLSALFIFHAFSTADTDVDPVTETLCSTSDPVETDDLIPPATPGFIDNLAKNWKGYGFNIITVPKKGGNIEVLVNAYSETIYFTPGFSGVINRAGEEAGQEVFTTLYQQDVYDLKHAYPIHTENGMWLHLREQGDPKLNPESYVRQSSIPHGDSLLGISKPGEFFTFPGKPILPPVDPLPFRIDDRSADKSMFRVTDTSTVRPAFLEKFTNPDLSALPDNYFHGKEAVLDPCIILRDDLKDQKITETITIEMSTSDIVNIPFIQRNANVSSMDAIFWVETVVEEDGSTFQQLQYLQRVFIDFYGLHWPHWSVATLREEKTP
eukprot:TRINITY_DN11527_c0_g1_i1.p1 TRINITY_DN11527_c0_g1~~TRINITY_DN11527_c0_g1_i1.p1  ORF type:complete len:327 (-),score=57.09 TRINITY_DN11527_c0_g1_i1:84-1064(-)